MFDPAIAIPPINHSQYVVPVAASKCERHAPPKVTVKVINKKVKYSTKKSSAQLGGFDIDTVSPYSSDVHTKISGLTASKIGVETGASISSSTNPILKTGCLWYEEIIVTIVNDPTVYIASEHKNNKCRYNKTLKHELKHVSVDRKTVREYSNKIKYAAQKQAKKTGAVRLERGKSLSSIQKEMLKEINSAIKVVVNKMNDVRKRRQQAIDSKKEYDRLSKSCGGKF